MRAFLTLMVSPTARIPSIAVERRTDPLWGGIGGDAAAVLPGRKLGILFFLLVLMWTIQVSASYLLISQAGWNRCNLLHSTSTMPSSTAQTLILCEAAPPLGRSWCGLGVQVRKRESITALCGWKGVILSLSYTSPTYRGLMRVLPGHPRS